MRCLAFLCCMLLPWSAGGQAAAWGLDLQGRPVERLTQGDQKLVVLIFAASDCPISNSYVPVIAELKKELQGQPVAFWWVYPNPADKADRVMAHRRQYAIEGNVALDTQQTLVRLAHARATPEAALFRVQGGSLRELYHGRIDDRYAAIGTERPKAQQHDLQEAIVDALAGRPIAHPVTRPTGCAIMPLAQ